MATAVSQTNNTACLELVEVPDFNYLDSTRGILAKRNSKPVTQIDRESRLRFLCILYSVSVIRFWI